MTIKRVAPDEALRMMEDEGYVYLDVRSVPEFADGRPKDAQNIAFMKMTPAGMKPNLTFIEEVAAQFSRGDKVLLGCKSGGRSARAAEALAQVGYTNIVDVAGGFDAWVPAGLPVSKG